MASPANPEPDPVESAENDESAESSSAVFGDAVARVGQEPREGEIDVWWGGYASRAMLPSALVCLAATGLIVLAAFVLVGWYNLPAIETRAAVYIAAGTLWVVQTGRWLYHVAGVTYRLTTRRLYCHWGIFYPPVPPLELARVRQAAVEQNFVERWLNVGRIRLEQAGQAPVVLPGVFNPFQVAEDIGRCVKTAAGTQPPAVD